MIAVFFCFVVICLSHIESQPSLGLEPQLSCFECCSLRGPKRGGGTRADGGRGSVINQSPTRLVSDSLTAGMDDGGACRTAASSHHFSR